jgi:hypothetical protein
VDKPEHPLKAEFPILVTLLGIVILVKPVQTEKASSPMLVILYSLSSYVSDAGIITLPLY